MREQLVYVCVAQTNGRAGLTERTDWQFGPYESSIGHCTGSRRLITKSATKRPRQLRSFCMWIQNGLTDAVAEVDGGGGGAGFVCEAVKQTAQSTAVNAYICLAVHRPPQRIIILDEEDICKTTKETANQLKKSRMTPRRGLFDAVWLTKTTSTSQLLWYNEH